MTRIVSKSLLFAICATCSGGGQSQPARQTAREALLEMFTSHVPDAFTRHLPESARRLAGSSDKELRIDLLQKIASLSHEMAKPGEQIESFREGPVMVSIKEQGDGGNRTEVVVERDEAQSNGEEIELSIHFFQEDKPQPIPVEPHLVFSMGEEQGVWRVNDATLLLRVPISDPEYLHGLRKAESASHASTAVSAIHTIVTAEITYAATYAQRGYTCQLSELGGYQEHTQHDQARAMLIDNALAVGNKDGYVFSVRGCKGNPADTFRSRLSLLMTIWSWPRFAPTNRAFCEPRKTGTSRPA